MKHSQRKQNCMNGRRTHHQANFTEAVTTNVRSISFTIFVLHTTTSARARSPAEACSSSFRLTYIPFCRSFVAYGNNGTHTFGAFRAFETFVSHTRIDRNHAHSIKSNRPQSGRHVSFCDFGQIACDVIYLYPVCSSLYKFDTIHAVYNNHVYRFSIAFVSEPRMHMASEALIYSRARLTVVAQKLREFRCAAFCTGIDWCENTMAKRTARPSKRASATHSEIEPNFSFHFGAHSLLFDS